MKRSNRLVILVGVLLAILAFVAIVILLNQRGGPTTSEPTTAPVLVAVEDIDIGEEVTPAKVEVAQVQLDAVVEPALTATSQVAGQPALFGIPSGSQVTGDAIGLGVVGGIADLPALLNPNEKAIAFQVDRATGLDFLIKQGDTIDILLSQQINVLQETADSAANPDAAAPPRFEAVTGLENQRTVKAVIQNKRVLYVSATRSQIPEPVDADGDGQADPDQPVQPVIDSVIIIFAGTAQDAEIIKFAQKDLTETGFLTAVVRHADNEALEETLGITIDQLVDEFGLRIPNIVEQLNEEATP